jgi:hypothetical protein
MFIQNTTTKPNFRDTSRQVRGGIVHARCQKIDPRVQPQTEGPQSIRPVFSQRLSRPEGRFRLPLLGGIELGNASSTDFTPATVAPIGQCGQPSPRRAKADHHPRYHVIIDSVSRQPMYQEILGFGLDLTSGVPREQGAGALAP